MSGILVLILIAVGFTALIVFAQKGAAMRKAEEEAFLTQHKGWDVYVSSQDRSILGVNHDERQIMVGRVGSSQAYAWSLISGLEVIKNGHAITSTNRGSQLGGAAIGGLLIGPAGLIVGGLSGSSKTKEQISEIKIKILVDDRIAPVHYVTFFSFPRGVAANSPVLSQTTARLDHFHALLVNAVRSETRPTSAHQSVSGNHLDEIEKLWRLKEMGAISDAEFISQKAAALAFRGVVEPSGPVILDHSVDDV